MKLQCVSSCRRNSAIYYAEIVREWEDQIVREMGIPLRYSAMGNRYLVGACRRGWRWVEFPMRVLLQKNSIAFIMRPFCCDGDVANNRHAIPVIIDFWLRSKREIEEFDRRYEKNPAVLITSKEAYDFLSSCSKLKNLHHWALSLPNQYAIDVSSKFEKSVDCVIAGRPNEMLLLWARHYAQTHENFDCIYNTRTIDEKNHYVSIKGKVLDIDTDTRIGYMNLLRSAKVGLYSTPGMDHSNDMSNGFSQITPRFLEYMSAGCHIISRYGQNSDTDYYGIEKISRSVENYKMFEQQMDFSLSHSVDMSMYSEYLCRHYTSTRIIELKKLLENVL